MTQMTELLDKNVKTVNIPVIHMFKSLEENRKQNKSERYKQKSERYK